MKRNLLNFTRGSQLLGHFGFMFAAGLKGPLLVTFIIAAWLSYWEVTEPPHVCRRLFGLSYAAMSCSSSMA